jgi:hypothetical protein
VLTQEGCLDATEHGVNDNSDWKQEASSGSWNSSQGMYDSATAAQQHGRHEDIRAEAENDVNCMRDSAIASSDDFQERMRVGSATLQFNGQCSEQNDLDSSSRGIPERTRNTTSS